MISMLYHIWQACPGSARGGEANALMPWAHITVALKRGLAAQVIKRAIIHKGPNVWNLSSLPLHRLKHLVLTDQSIN